MRKIVCTSKTTNADRKGEGGDREQRRVCVCVCVRACERGKLHECN